MRIGIDQFSVNSEHLSLELQTQSPRTHSQLTELSDIDRERIRYVLALALNEVANLIRTADK